MKINTDLIPEIGKKRKKERKKSHFHPKNLTFLKKLYLFFFKKMSI
jgi:hypothetical protein